MPLIKVQLATEPDREKAEGLLKSFSRMLAEETGKPEKYVMVLLERGQALLGGESGPAAFVDVRGIGGFNRQVNTSITRAICEILKSRLGIEPDRVYV
ncbi:MAG: hypothetical protein FJ224_05855, partial [Lentisphaerae bacterium]|nr:hypothetical protein [Lentisphaerota bacterium]